MNHSNPPCANNSDEDGLIGCCLLHAPGFHDAAKAIRPADFGSVANSIIWRTMLTLRAAGKQVDGLTLARRLESIDKLKLIGGIERIVELTHIVPDGGRVDQFIAAVKAAADQRRENARAA